MLSIETHYQKIDPELPVCMLVKDADLGELAIVNGTYLDWTVASVDAQDAFAGTIYCSRVIA